MHLGPSVALRVSVWGSQSNPDDHALRGYRGGVTTALGPGERRQPGPAQTMSLTHRGGVREEERRGGVGRVIRRSMRLEVEVSGG